MNGNGVQRRKSENSNGADEKKGWNREKKPQRRWKNGEGTATLNIYRHNLGEGRTLKKNGEGLYQYSIYRYNLREGLTFSHS